MTTRLSEEEFDDLTPHVRRRYETAKRIAADAETLFDWGIVRGILRALLLDELVDDTTMNRMVASCYDQVDRSVWAQIPPGFEVDWGKGMVMPRMPRV